ncbi:MAG: ArnT family glycosyltransferase [Thermoplasmatota archaeon]
MARERRLSTFEWACAALVALGIASRLVQRYERVATADVDWYMTMAESFRRFGEFVFPWSSSGTIYTQHYPPAFPVFVSLFFRALGPSFASTQLASIAAGVLLIGVVLGTTWDLFGRARGLAAAAVVACLPLLIDYDLSGYTETLVVAFFALTIWGILRSLTQPRFILVAGLFAAAGYLTKSSMGYFVVLAGLGGLAWRVKFRGWRSLLDPWYIAAASLVVATVLAWAYRNVLRHGWPNWETQAHATYSLQVMWHSPTWPVVLVGELAWSTAVLAAFFLPWLGNIRASARAWRDEATSALLMAVVVPLLIANVFITAFFLAEGEGTVFYIANKRYLITAIPPLLWLAFRELDLAAPTRNRLGVEQALFWTGVAALALAFALDPTRVALTMPRLLAFAAMLAVGAALVGASRLFETTSRERVRADGRRELRSVAAPSAPPLLAFVALGAGFLVGWLFALALVPFFVATYACLTTRDARARVVAFAIILLGASFAGLYVGNGVEASTHDIGAAVAREGLTNATVSVADGQESYFWPTLDPGVKMVDDKSVHDATFVILFIPSPGETERANYTTWRTYGAPAILGPGTAVEQWVEAHWLGGAPRDEPATSVVVLRHR